MKSVAFRSMIIRIRVAVRHTDDGPLSAGRRAEDTESAAENSAVETQASRLNNGPESDQRCHHEGSEGTCHHRWATKTNV